MVYLKGGLGYPFSFFGSRWIMIYKSLLEYLTLAAGIVSPLVLILGAGYQYLIKPWEKRKAKEVEKAQKERLAQDKEYQNKMLEITREQMSPILKVLEELKAITVESNYDRKNLNSIAKENKEAIKEHDERLDDHDMRLIVLETNYSGGHQTVTYKEKYGNRKEDKK